MSKPLNYKKILYAYMKDVKHTMGITTVGYYENYPTLRKDQVKALWRVQNKVVADVGKELKTERKNNEKINHNISTVS